MNPKICVDKPIPNEIRVKSKYQIQCQTHSLVGHNTKSCQWGATVTMTIVVTSRVRG